MSILASSQLTAVLRQFSLTLNKEGQKLALCTFGASSVSYDHYDETFALKVYDSHTLFVFFFFLHKWPVLMTDR